MLYYARSFHQRSCDPRGDLPHHSGGNHGGTVRPPASPPVHKIVRKHSRVIHPSRETQPMKTRQLLLLSAASLGVITAVVLWPDSGPQAVAPVPHKVASRPIPGEDDIPGVSNKPAAAGVEASAAVATEEVPVDFGAWAQETPPQPDFAKLEAFDGWVERWIAA